MINEKTRKLSYHPSYKKYPAVPCVLIGNREVAKKYGWQVGDKIKVELKEEGILITKK